jgi:hypothetical protein
MNKNLLQISDDVVTPVMIEAGTSAYKMAVADDPRQLVLAILSRCWKRLAQPSQLR